MMRGKNPEAENPGTIWKKKTLGEERQKDRELGKQKEGTTRSADEKSENKKKNGGGGKRWGTGD